MVAQLREQKCPICNKIFIPAPYHGYKTHNKARYVCSYHCMLASERDHEAKKAKKREGAARGLKGR